MSAPAKNRTRFVAEVSSNHNRDLKRSLDFIDAAADVGCDAVKFQLFKIDELFAPEILAQSERHRRRKNWELPVSMLPALAEHCQKRKIEFSCTPFYIEAVEELLPYVAFYKVASYELLWHDLHKTCIKTGKPLVLAAGMATMDEIGDAVRHARAQGCADLTLLHCTSSYPTPVDQANLAAIGTIRNAFDVPVGWSDHTVSPAVVLRAVERWGATMVEFHLDLDGKGDEFGAGHCWLPDQIASVIKLVRAGEIADGDGEKVPVPAELPDREWRADPSDGLRPMKHLRNTWVPPKNHN
jgi:sialic acid synthase SpsE